ncbi:antitoxin Xre/MbcA/ParS toxin-binding domain-containing protein [Pseudopedobacter sp.]|uniref:antitoxin Xre/MbcA/ParS toxin-binding domain-containing protein n=1 Tax=Pseudopedobacter sp. TaxID=1936787 RepID=UPI0033417838
MATIVSDKNKAYKVIDEILSVNDSTSIYSYISTRTIDNRYIKILDEIANVNESTISNWLNITTKTFRNYKNKESHLKGNTKEHIVSLLSLYKHGFDVFESQENFEKWLTSNNYMLDNKAPMDFLDTISGIRFIDDRLTAMEFGENV